MTVNNTSSALWQAITTTAGTTTTTGNIFVAQTLEVTSYDLDGNLFQDGWWTYTWDGENLLIGMNCLSTAPSESKRRLTFEYDELGRRIGKKVYVWPGSAHPASPNTTLKLLYDGWNLLTEFDAGNAIVRNYQWGLNLSGSPQSAGGVDGLLSARPAGGTAQFIGYDGNGNVTIGVDAGTGNQVSSLEYGPFGESVRSSGSGASASMFRFPTKYGDAETGWSYYGHRFYNAATGRWLNRDPIEEAGGLNSSCWLENDGLNRIDRLGLEFACKEQGPTVLVNIPQAGRDILFGWVQWVGQVGQRNKMQPQVKLYPGLVEPCCWHTFLNGGFAQPLVAIDKYIEPSKAKATFEHARGHVKQFYAAYLDFKNHANAIGGLCLSRGGAECFRGVILKEMNDFYSFRPFAEGANSDLGIYGDLGGTKNRVTQATAQLTKLYN